MSDISRPHSPCLESLGSGLSFYFPFLNVLIVCPGFPAESITLSEKKRDVSVECRWMHMNREGARGEGESMRDLGKSIAYLLIFVSEWMSGDLCVCV